MAESQTFFPTYSNPPIIELVLGVQFDPIAGFTTGHSGWFWRDHLGADWKASEAPPILEQTEAFGVPRPVKMSLQIAKNATRLMVENLNGDRLLQIQNTRFHYNWKKKGSHYPHFKNVFEEFFSHLKSFSDFVEKAGLAPLSLNQWEVTYIDGIAGGVLWQSADDFHNVFPGLFPPKSNLGGLKSDDSSVERSYIIDDNAGRLHVAANLAFVGKETVPSLVVNMTARGPISSQSIDDLKEHMEIGHRATGEAFAGLSSDQAKNFWGPKS